MKLTKEIKIWLIGIVFVATLAVLFGGQLIATKVKVEDPLKHDVYAFKSVEKFTVEQQNDDLKVILKLKKVPNLQELLENIAQKVQFYYGKPVTSFVVTDRPDNHLKQVKYTLSFYLEEAQASGHYIRLAQELDTFPGVKAKVYLGEKFVYLQLEEKDHYLYQTFPRETALNNANTQHIGGESTG